VSPVRNELGFISQKTAFFIVTAVKTSNLTSIRHVAKDYSVLAAAPFLLLFSACEHLHSIV
jgi:hypothetical protein